METLVADLERVTSERDEFRDAYQRTAADFDNFRKQSQRRIEDEVARTLGRARGAAAAGARRVRRRARPRRHRGRADRAALLGALEKEGLVRVDPIGEVFDPTVAEAVVHEPGDGGEHVVSEVMRAGYTWQGRVLRPAMVKVTD